MAGAFEEKPQKKKRQSGRKNCSFAPLGLIRLPHFSHGVRRGCILSPLRGLGPAVPWDGRGRPSSIENQLREQPWLAIQKCSSWVIARANAAAICYLLAFMFKLMRRVDA